jgi:catabolite regulation protein CreA
MVQQQQLDVIDSFAGCACADADKFGEFAASGFIFKDTVDVIAFEDPEVRLDYLCFSF